MASGIEMMIKNMFGIDPAQLQNAMGQFQQLINYMTTQMGVIVETQKHILDELEVLKNARTNHHTNDNGNSDDHARPRINGSVAGNS